VRHSCDVFRRSFLPVRRAPEEVSVARSRPNGEAFLLQVAIARRALLSTARTTSAISSRAFADVGGADLCGGLPVVKVAAYRRTNSPSALVPMEKQGDIELPRLIAATSRQRHGVHEGVAHSDPQRQLMAYRPNQRATLNSAARIRTGGFAQSGSVHQWIARLPEDSPQSRRYKNADRISDALNFMRACGLDLRAHPELRATDFYTSHEALLLGYEQAFTGVWSSTTGDLVTHFRFTMIWIGDRTRQSIMAMSNISAGIKQSDRSKWRGLP